MRTSLLLILSAAVLVPVAASADDEAGKQYLTPKAAEAVRLARMSQVTDPSTADTARKGTDPGPKKGPAPGELAARYAAPRTTHVFVQRDGSVVAQLGDEYMNDLVVVKNADGSISKQCGTATDPHVLEVHPATEEK